MQYILFICERCKHEARSIWNEKPIGWLHTIKGTICPGCAKQYKEMVDKFFNKK